MKDRGRWIPAAGLTVLVYLMTVVAAHAASGTPRARYVFLFIGDGMARAQITLTEAYLANKIEPHEAGGSRKTAGLNMSKLPVQGMCSTFPWNGTITDSAAAATALATGRKTANGVVSMDPTGKIPYRTLAELAKTAGMRVGIVSSVSLDSATPACFYAHEPSRSNTRSIGRQLVTSGFDFFGGGRLKDTDGVDGNPSIDVRAAGYTVADTKAALDALLPGRKAIAFNPVVENVRNSQTLAYAIDRSSAVAADPSQAENHLTLAQYTSKAVSLLDNPRGFFLMVEGGKIDWACHANDARAVIDEMIAFDDAVAVAIDFMKRRPSSTLIVVTGDHETGGLSLGWAGTAYASHLEKLEAQKVSFVEFDKIWTGYKKACGGPGCPDDLPGELKSRIQTVFGLDWATLTDFDRKRLEEAYDKSLDRPSGRLPEEDALLYGSHIPLTVTVTHVLNNRAGVGWTSFSHTAIPVPVIAGGCGASAFFGYYDNTDVARKLARAMSLPPPN